MMKLNIFLVFTLASFSAIGQAIVAPAQDSNNEGGELVLIKSNSNFNDWYLDNYAGNLRFFHDGLVHFNLNSTGNLGVGTSNPTSKLFIKQSFDNSTGGLSIQDAATGRMIQIYGEGSGGRQVIRTSGTTNPLAFDLNGIEKMRINSNGNIGIGTNTPGAKLHITDEGTSGETTLQLNNRIKFRGDGVINWGASSNHGILSWDTGRTIIGGLSGQDLSINANASEKIRIKSNGNVGIGTTDTKGFKLGVNGKIAALEVKVATYANWSDFVFLNNYNLPTLKEVEEHIKEKGHLKDIPSAEEVEKDGFFLGEMNSKLLQKIEELTLYTIEQQKEIESLKKENNKFKSLSVRLAEIEKIMNNKQQ